MDRYSVIYCEIIWYDYFMPTPLESMLSFLNKEKNRLIKEMQQHQEMLNVYESNMASKKEKLEHTSICLQQVNILTPLVRKKYSDILQMEIEDASRDLAGCQSELKRIKSRQDKCWEELKEIQQNIEALENEQRRTLQQNQGETSGT